MSNKKRKEISTERQRLADAIKINVCNFEFLAGNLSDPLESIVTGVLYTIFRLANMTDLHAKTLKEKEEKMLCSEKTTSASYEIDAKNFMKEYIDQCNSFMKSIDSLGKYFIDLHKILSGFLVHAGRSLNLTQRELTGTFYFRETVPTSDEERNLVMEALDKMIKDHIWQCESLIEYAESMGKNVSAAYEQLSMLTDSIRKSAEAAKAKKKEILCSEETVSTSSGHDKEDCSS